MTTRTMTAAEAAQDTELWERVQRGEVRVENANGAEFVDGRMDGARPKLRYGIYSWCVGDDDSFWHEKPDMPLTVADIPVAEQSRNSPANVERLTAEIARLREFLAGAGLLNGYDATRDTEAGR